MNEDYQNYMDNLLKEVISFLEQMHEKHGDHDSAQVIMRAFRSWLMAAVGHGLVTIEEVGFEKFIKKDLN